MPGEDVPVNDPIPLPAGVGGMILVLPIPTHEADSWLLVRHYAKRHCPVSYAFAAYRDRGMLGVVTFGTPASAPLREGICGPEWADKVLELNRLCCESEKNLASKLVSAALRMLPRPCVVVSFADTEQGHIGYVYQACNFVYTGLSAKRTDWKIKGQEHLHGATVADMSRGQENRADYMRQTFGSDFYLQDRPRKHRYIYAVGNRVQRRNIMAALRYKIEEYPKGATRRSVENVPIQTQSMLL